MMNETELFERLRQALSRLGDLSTGDRMDVLFVADCTVADTERQEAVASGRAHERRESQLHRLERVVALLRTEKPDREIERMVHEEDWDGVRRRYRQRLNSMSADQPGA